MTGNTDKKHLDPEKLRDYVEWALNTTEEEFNRYWKKTKHKWEKKAKKELEKIFPRVKVLSREKMEKLFPNAKVENRANQLEEKFLVRFPRANREQRKNIHQNAYTLACLELKYEPYLSELDRVIVQMVVSK